MIILNRLTKRFLLFLLIFSGIQIDIYRPVNSSDNFPVFRKLSSECFLISKIDSCRRALIEAERIQRRAGHQKNYPCQTEILGVEADLIMTELQQGRGQIAFDKLEGVDHLCRN